nr:alpha/beta hydrolase [Phycicoccus sp. Soil803]
MCLIHGWGATAASWLPVIAELDAGWDVRCTDLPGHGSRAGHGLTSPLTVADLAADVAGWLGAEPTVVVGHSMGAQVAVALALREEVQVSALVLVDPAFGAEPAEMAGAPDRLADLRSRGALAGVEFVDGAFPDGQPHDVWLQARREMAATPGQALADLYESMYLAPDSMGPTDRAAAVLGRVRVPVLYLFSTSFAAGVANAYPKVPGSRVQEWVGTTHYLHQQRPEEFAQLVQGWVGGVRST